METMAVDQAPKLGRAAGAAPTAWTAERRALTAGLLLSVTAVGFEALAVATVLPAIAAELGGRSLYGWTFSAFMLTNLVAIVIAGRVADQRGPARPFATGLVLFGAGLVIAGLAPSMLIVVIGRAVQGAGAGAIGAMSYVSLGRGYPDALRARVLALLSSAWVLPALIGPAAAGLVAEQATWRLVFLGLLPLLGLAAALMLPALRRLDVAAPAAPTPGRVRSAALLAVGVGLALAATTAGQPLLVAPLLVVGAALAVPALRRVLPPGTLSARPGLPAGLAANGLLSYTFFGTEAFLPLGLTELRGQSLARAGVVLTATALAWTAGSWLQARLDTRGGGRGRKLRVLAGFAGLLAGGGLTALTVLHGSIPVWLATAGWAIAGLGMGLAYSSLSLLALRHAPAGQEGMVSGSLRLTEVLGVALGAGVGGAAVAFADAAGRPASTGIAAAFALTLGGGVVGLLCARNLSSAPAEAGL
jgi:MFS family permease